MALGRTKIGRRQKADSYAEPEVAEPDHELDDYLAALAPEESVETTGSGRRFGVSQVYQLRLPLMANEKLKELAAKQGTSPAALARDWVMQHLALEDQDAPAQPQDSATTQQPTHQQTQHVQPPTQQVPAPGQQHGGHPPMAQPPTTQPPTTQPPTTRQPRPGRPQPPGPAQPPAWPQEANDGYDETYPGHYPQSGPQQPYGDPEETDTEITMPRGGHQSRVSPFFS
ncbi:hypothetical protein HUO13_35295 [Saccharopolyspora erythraea]|uniref:hypothetical protein n=1 Tax=Saccharopolyspora erythraea TaxID=1836 RepID=UPI001BAADF47|nr:hypothetical protein [Saccharopolyspora erythraea]QUH05347.1 hypothetical protein HUO13_35295 [Saccharopolyspora erythraea]